MLKAGLIAIAAMLVIDAAAWHGAIRTGTVRQVTVFVSNVAGLDWRWL